MLVVKLISDLSDNPYIILDKNNLNLFLSQVKVLKEENTYLNDFIRILNFNDIISSKKLQTKMKSLLEG